MGFMYTPKVKQELSTNTRLILHSKEGLGNRRDSPVCSICWLIRTVQGLCTALDSKGFAGVQVQAPRPKYSSWQWASSEVTDAFQVNLTSSKSTSYYAEQLWMLLLTLLSFVQLVSTHPGCYKSCSAAFPAPEISCFHKNILTRPKVS